MKLRIHAAVALTFAFAYAATAAETEYYWGKVDGSNNGYFNDPAHWHVGSTSGETGTMPDHASRAYIKVNDSFTVSFPEGYYTNFAKFSAAVYNGKTVTIDGRNTVFLHPRNDAGDYSNYPFEFTTESSAWSFFDFCMNSATPTPASSPHMVISNFLIQATRPSNYDIRLTFKEGDYDFLNPCGHVWGVHNQKPYFCISGLNNNASSYKDLMETIEVKFNAGTSFSVPVIGFFANAATNRLVLSGREHRFAVVEMAAGFEGWGGQARGTLSEFVVDGGTAEVTNRFGFGMWAWASNNVQRAIVKNGGFLRIPTVPENLTIYQANETGYGEILADGGTLTFGCDAKASQHFDGRAYRIAATNNSTIIVDHAGNTGGQNGQWTHLGLAAGTAGTSIRHFMNIDNSAIVVKPMSGIRFYGATVNIRNKSTVSNSGALHLDGSTGGMPLTFSVVDSVVSNINTFTVGAKGPATLMLKDGGTFVNSGTFNGGTYAALKADGGTIRAGAASASFASGFASATIGANGLTIDSAGYDVTVTQSFADATGESGLLLLAGGGAKTMSGDLSGVSSVAVAGGSASFSSTLGALAVTNGATLKLNPSATLAVGSITLADLFISLSSTVAIGNTYDLVAVENEPSAATVAAWQNAFVTAGLPAGAAADLSCENVGSGYVLRMTVRAAQSLDISLDAGTETRTGDISYAPQDTLTATVAAGADLTLSGAIGMGTLVKAGDGALRLSSADNFFAPGLLLTAGSISTANPNAIKVGSAGTIRAKHGVLEVLGPAGGAVIDAQISMVKESTNDIFIVKNEVDLTMPCPNGNGTTGEFLKRGAGALTLTVEGTKTLTGGSGYAKINNGIWSWDISNISQLTFDDTTGMLTTNGVPAFLIVEGELRFKGVGAGARVVHNGLAAIGTSTKVGTVQPGLVLDNVSFEQTVWPHYYMQVSPGINYHAVAPVTRSGDFVKEPYVILTNGARLVTGNYQFARLAQSDTLRPRLEVDGSTFEISNCFYVNRAQDESVSTFSVFRNGAKAYIKEICPGYDGEMLFDNSVLAWNSSLEPTTITPESLGSTTSSGRFFFRNGSKLYCAKVNAEKLNLTNREPLTLTFDDSEWIPATTNFVFSYDADRISIVATNIGLRLPVPEGKTWTMNHRVTGPGGLANDGEGTLVLGANAVGYEGATVAGENATVDLGGNGLPVRIGGAGTFTNGTVANGGIALEIDDAGAAVEVPTVASDVTFSGTVRVLAGRTAETPLSEPYATFDVLKYDGSAPDVSAFRLRGTGVSGLRGKFAVDAGRQVVVCTPEKHGFILEVR